MSDTATLDIDISSTQTSTTGKAGPAYRDIYDRMKVRRIQGKRQSTGEITSTIPQVQHHIRSFLRAGAAQRNGIRQLIIDEIKRAQNAAPAMAALVLTECVQSSRPSRIDDAIEILSAVGIPIIQIIPKLFENERSSFWTLPDDYQFVLVRLAGDSKDQLGQALFEESIARLTGAACEAGVTVLGNRGDARSLDKLRWVADRSPCESIRRLANDYLSE